MDLTIEGRCQSGASVRRQLEALRPGEWTCIIGKPGQTAHDVQKQVSSQLCKMETPSVEFTQKTALLVVDPHTAPIGCSIVQRRPE